MGIQTEDIRDRLYLRLDQYGLNSVTTDSLIDSYIEGVATELASKNLDCLLRTKYTNTDEDGKFYVDESIIPYTVMSDGIKNQIHSWQRLSPVDYLYFINSLSRISFGKGIGSFHGRYTILPTPGEDGTTLQLLDNGVNIPIMLVYYPITPSISDFPDFAADLITNMVLERYIIDRKDSMKDRSIKLLMDHTKKLEKIFDRQSTAIEATYYDSAARNTKTKNWIYSESNDFSYWNR